MSENTLAHDRVRVTKNIPTCSVSAWKQFCKSISTKNALRWSNVDQTLQLKICLKPPFMRDCSLQHLIMSSWTKPTSACFMGVSHVVKRLGHKVDWKLKCCMFFELEATSHLETGIDTISIYIIKQRLYKYKLYKCMNFYLYLSNSYIEIFGKLVHVHFYR